MSCRSYCEHGAICVLDRGHDGLHTSRYCEWDDAHALTEAEADAVLAQADGGETYLAFKEMLAPLFGDEKL